METSEHSVPLQAHQNNLHRFLHNEILLELIDFHISIQFWQAFSERKKKRLVEDILLALFESLCMILKEKQNKATSIKNKANQFTWVLSRDLSTVVLQKDLMDFYLKNIFSFKYL